MALAWDLGELALYGALAVVLLGLGRLQRPLHPAPLREQEGAGG
ncbi:MAG: hypothetical protein R3F60_19735 [bacterium]